MSHDYSLARSIAFACLWTLLFTAGQTLAQPGSAAPQKPATPSGTPSGDATKSDSTKKSSSKTKGDVGVDIDAKLKAKKKEDRKPNFEIRAIRTSPSDSITYFKHNHWTLFHLDMMANNSDENVEIRTGFEPAPDPIHEIRFRRSVHLVKEQNRLYRLPVLLTHDHNGKFIELGLYHPDGVMPIIPPGIEKQPCTSLEADQFLIMPLALEPDKYHFLQDMQCVIPGSETDDDEKRDRRRYYYSINTLQPNRPLVADTALAWTTTSYAIWDDLDPGVLSARQQEAMIDWLHWGGQLIVSGGSVATKLENSFLTPYLPADVVGSDSTTDLSSLSGSYLTARSIQHPLPQVMPIHILPTKPVYLAKLQPRPGSKVTEPEQVKQSAERPLLVERQVGRGRVIMAAFSLYQPELVNWKEGYDRLWQEKIFKVPETQTNPSFQLGNGNMQTYVRLPARKLSRLFYLSRDLGAEVRRSQAATRGSIDFEAGIPSVDYFSPSRESQGVDTVAEWRDDTPVPSAARQTLHSATGIQIPPPEFVLVAGISYLVVLVPLNWLICRIAFRRQEVAWLAAPVIILGFSLGIVKFAKVNVGFDTASNEIDVVELYAGYPRAHLSRFTCIYSGSRTRCEFRYDDPAAVAVPMAVGSTQRGQKIDRLSLDWDMSVGFPVSVGRYEVHPRSIGMMRAEEMMPLSGPILFQPGDSSGDWVIDNQTGIELWDCHLVTSKGKTRLGDLRSGERIEIPPSGIARADLQGGRTETTAGHRIFSEKGDSAGHSTIEEFGKLNPQWMTGLFEKRTLGLGPRLVAWAPRAMGGQQIDPKPDRAIGFTVFVVHLEKP